jgi:drug/metabolite transporter (DMT)-like permease
MIQLRPATIVARFNRLPPIVRGAVLMTGSGMSFAMMMVLVRHVSATVHPFEAAFFRNVFGLAFMMPWLLRSGVKALATRRFGGHVMRALFGLSAMLCLFMALSLMPLAEVTALTFAAPLFATLGAALVLKERVRLRRWAATLVGFLGVMLILRPGMEVISPAALVALGAAAFMASAFLCVRSLARTEHPAAIVIYFGLLVTPMSLIPALFVWTTPTLELLFWFLLLGLAATGGQLLMTRAFAAAEASAVMPFDFSRLVFVSLFGMMLFGEMPDGWTYVGAAIILAAAVYITHRESRARRTPPEHLT